MGAEGGGVEEGGCVEKGRHAPLLPSFVLVQSLAFSLDLAILRRKEGRLLEEGARLEG